MPASAEAVGLGAALPCLVGLLTICAYDWFLRRRAARLDTEDAITWRRAPAQLSAGELAAFSRAKVDAQCVAGVLVSLAEKGAIRIAKEERKLVLHWVGPQENLSKDERIVAAVVERSSPLALDRDGRGRVGEMTEGLVDWFGRAAAGLFVGNQVWVIAGFVISAAFLVASLVRAGYGLAAPAAAFLGSWLLAYPWALSVRSVARPGTPAAVPLIVRASFALAVPAAGAVLLPQRSWLLVALWLLLALANVRLKSLWWLRTAAGKIIQSAARERVVHIGQLASSPAAQIVHAEAVALGAPFPETNVSWYGPGRWTRQKANGLVNRLHSAQGRYQRTHLWPSPRLPGASFKA